MPQYVNILLEPGVEYSTSQLSFDLSQDEGSYAWTAQVELGAIDDYQRINIGDPVVLTVEDEQYHLVIDSKSLNRNSPANVQLQFTAISPIVFITQPWVLPYSKTWDAPQLASSIAEEVASIANLSLSWEILDWVVPANLLSVEEGDPLDAILSLATAAGATVESGIDGTVRVRNVYPLSPQYYGTTAPQQIIEDLPDKISVSSPVAMGPYFNYLELGNEEILAEGDDTIEFIVDEDNPLSGVLRVYPYPWRTEWQLSNTGPTSVQLSRIGEKTEQQTELLTFTENTSTTAYPVHTLDSTDWNIVDLGALIFDQYKDELTATGNDPYGYSMANVTYTKRFVEYKVSGQLEDAANIIMLEDVANG
jgi:hypothetical protein